MSPSIIDPYAAGGVFGIVLVPERGSVAAFVDASRELNGLAPSLFSCGTETVLPHVTLIHVQTSEAEARTLWNDAKSELPSRCAVEAFAFYLRPSEGGLWVGVSVRTTRAIVQAHATVVQLAAKHGVMNLTESGEYYWPHITLGRWKDALKIRLPLHSAVTSTFAALPMLAHMGEHGTVVSVLAA